MPDSGNFIHIIGHRGAAGRHFENSMDGFNHALALDISAVELDIREHRGELWVFHDDELERLTGKPGCFETQADIGKLELNNGEKIPRLKQVLDLYWGKKPLNIEIKSMRNNRLLLDLLAQYPDLPTSPGLPWIWISSFNHQNILQLRQLGCRWPLALLSYGIPVLVDEFIELIAPYSWHFDNEYLDFGLLDHLKSRGLRSMVYTVNDQERAKMLQQHGVDGIFTDFPAEMRSVN